MGVLFVLRSIMEVKQKRLALFPPFWLPTEGFEVKTAPSRPLFGLRRAETLPKSVPGTARTLLLRLAPPLTSPCKSHTVHRYNYRVYIPFREFFLDCGREGVTSLTPVAQLVFLLFFS